MSDFFGLSMPNFSGVGSSMVDFLIYILIAAFVGAILWGCFYLLTFKHLVRIRQHTASGYVLIHTKAREFTTREGAKKWRFLKWIKTSYMAPPVDYLELTSKGKFSIDCDRTLDGVVVWRKISGDPDASDAFTSEERTMTAMEMRRAEEYKKEGLVNKLLNLAPMFLAVMIVVLLLAFWGDFVNTTTTGLDKALKEQTLAMGKLDDALSRLECAPTGNFTVRVDNKGQSLPVPDKLPPKEVPN